MDIDPHHERSDGRMLEKAIRKGWVEQRWPTEATKEEIQKDGEEGGSTLKHKAVVATHALVESEKARAKGIGIRLAIAMEKQNQADAIDRLTMKDFQDKLAAIIRVARSFIRDPEQAERCVQMMLEAASLGGAASGTDITPDRDVLEMDETVPAAAPPTTPPATGAPPCETT